MQNSKMRRTVFKILIVLLVACMGSACSNTRHLPAGERLFTGSRVHIKDQEAGKREKKILRKDLAGLVRPRPNRKTLGLMRLKLTMYNLAGDTKKTKGLRQWFRNKAGEPPVLVSSVDLNNNRELMVNFLENRGYFNARVSAKFDSVGNKKSKAAFEVTTGPQYKINEVYFRKDSSEVSGDIDSNFDKTMLTAGSGYNLEVIKAERARIDRMLKEVGY